MKDIYFDKKECVYVIGINDNGQSTGITYDDLCKSVDIIKIIAKECSFKTQEKYVNNVCVILVYA